MKALVVGGTGPTGPFIVNGLLARGFDVAIFHRGTHESEDIPASVEHIHGDPHFAEAIEEALRGRTFDLVVVTYGRLRHLAEALRGRTRRFIAVGGVAAYRGYKEPERLFPAGMLVPTSEAAPLVRDDDEVHFSRLIAESEDATLRAHPSATIFRYPYVYGPHQLIPREWCVIRRILDKRRYIVVPEGGLSLASHGYAENLGHAVLLAVDQPEAASGQIYNCGDETTLTMRQLIEIIAATMNATLEIVSVPAEAAVPSRALSMREDAHHWVMDISKIKRELGYRDLVAPIDAVKATVAWYLANPPEPGGETETRLADPFDYAAEDRLIEIQADALRRMRDVSVRGMGQRPHAYAHPKAPGERDHRAR